jgi:hypothetical protein
LAYCLYAAVFFFIYIYIKFVGGLNMHIV